MLLTTVTANNAATSRDALTDQLGPEYAKLMDEAELIAAVQFDLKKLMA